MTGKLSALIGALFVSAGLLLCAVVSGGSTEGPAEVVPVQSAVYVDEPMTLGSGVYIGNNLVVTAAHVVGKNKSANIYGQDGESLNGNVLWADTNYDIALLKLDGTNHLPSSELACRPPKLRERLELVGNPLGIRFIHMFGHVARESKLPDDHLQGAAYFFADITNVPGFSGGPAYDAEGKVIGIDDAVMVLPSHDKKKPDEDIFGFAVFVPSNAVCNLIAQHK